MRNDRNVKSLFPLAVGAILTLGGFLALAGTAHSDGRDRDDGRHHDHDRDGDRLQFEAQLSGAQEVPTVMTDASGRVSARFDESLSAVLVRLKVEDPSSDVVAAHFHCARPGTNGPVAFGLFSPGPCQFDGERIKRCVLTNADFTGADCTATTGRPVNNIAALAFAMRDGLIYANVHTVTSPGGEVRGQIPKP